MGATAAVTCVARVGVREAGTLSAEDARLRFSENCETSHIRYIRSTFGVVISHHLPRSPAIAIIHTQANLAPPHNLPESLPPLLFLTQARALFQFSPC